MPDNAFRTNTGPILLRLRMLRVTLNLSVFNKLQNNGLTVSTIMVYTCQASQTNSLKTKTKCRNKPTSIEMYQITIRIRSINRKLGFLESYHARINLQFRSPRKNENSKTLADSLNPQYRFQQCIQVTNTSNTSKNDISSNF